MKNILAEIYQHKLIEVRNCKKVLRLEEICRQLKCADEFAAKNVAKNSAEECVETAIIKDSTKLKASNFIAALQSKISQNKIALIAEIKKASPSKGLIRENFNAVEIAQEYEKNGAACLSVLTDSKYFQGSNEYLQQARANSSLPILRKDFMIDVYQIYEAKMLGASCILLIVAMLDDAKLQELEECALGLGLSVLIEVHDEAELRRALGKLKSKLIGINNRNLKTLQVDLQTSLRLAPLVPQGYIIVGESGIKTKDDIKMLQKVGINTFLIGEHFMSEANVGAAVRRLLD